MKLNLKYAFIIAALIFGSIGTLLLFLMPHVANIIEDIALTSFLSEIKSFAKVKNYDFLFTGKPHFGYYYVLDNEGITVQHTDSSKIGIDAKTAVPGLFEYMKEKKEGIYSYVYQNIKRYIAFIYDGEKYLAHAATEDDLLKGLKRINSTILSLFLPISIISSLVIGYFFGELLLKPTKKQYLATNNLLKNVSENIVSTASSTAEIKSLAQSTEMASLELDKAVEEFAAYSEESRAEIETTLYKLKDFTNTIEEITHSVTELTKLIESITGFVEKITEVSDNITVLAINASIETSKESIDREGLSRIAEMIMELSNSTRLLAKESKNSLKDVEKVVASTVLVTEKISKDLNQVRESLELINQITQSSTQNTEKLSKISRATHESVEQLYAGVEQLEEAVNGIKLEIEKFGNMFKGIKF
ncbi:MAG: methyl-accepting chemotaxis protein [Fervidobacterium sp.]